MRREPRRLEGRAERGPKRSPATLAGAGFEHDIQPTPSCRPALSVSATVDVSDAML